MPPLMVLQERPLTLICLVLIFICSVLHIQPLLFAGVGMYGAIKLCKAAVSTICTGLATSMDVYLLAAGS